MATAETVERKSSDTAATTTSIESFRPLTDIEVAERLGVSRFTVRSWRLKGTGPRFLKMGRAVRYRAEDVAAYERQVLVQTEATNPGTH